MRKLLTSTVIVLALAPINYLRGRSIHDTAIIVDDAQNLTQEDMKLVLTRAGEGSRVILTGDPDQIDREEITSLSTGLVQVVERFKNPFIDHKLTDILVNHDNKIKVRLNPSQQEYAQKFGKRPQILDDVLGK